MFSLRRRHFLIGVLVLFTLATNAFVAYWNIARIIRNERLVAQTFAAQAQIESIVSFSKDVETGGRGFLLTGDDAYLEPLRRGQSQLDSALQTLERTTTDPQQKNNVPRLRALVKSHLSLVRRAIELRRGRGSDAAIRFFRAGQNPKQLDSIRTLAGKMFEREGELLAQRTGESNDSAQDAFRTFWIATLANLAFLALISWLLLQASRANRTLERAVRDLKRAEGLRDSLAQMLVHDLRSPLTTLLGPLHMLEAEVLGPLDSSQREVVTMSAKSGQRLLGMVNGLLDISKLEAGELKLSPSTFGVCALLQSACQEAKRDGDTSTARLQLEAPPDLTMHADHDLMERVVINLLSNALKFTPAIGHICVRAFAVENRVRVEVEDSGEGIPGEDLERIFDKFGQVESRKSGVKNSTGLGLTFCKLAVEAHGGTIGVSSEVGKGSVFWLEIPL